MTSTTSSQPYGGHALRFNMDQCNKLGAGSFATVYKGHMNNKRVAVKVFDTRNGKGLAESQREKQVMQKISAAGCSHCCGLVDTVITGEATALAMDFVQGQNLLESIQGQGAWSEERARPFVAQLLEGLRTLHAAGIAHRDIKCENVMVEDHTDGCRFVDFGLAAAVPPQGLKGDVGSAGYQAPECLDGKSYGTEVDMWSLGTVIFSLLTGVPAFYASKRHSINEMIRDVPIEEVLGKRWASHISDEAHDLLMGLLVRDQHKRMTAEQALRHPFLRGVGLNYMATSSCRDEGVVPQQNFETTSATSTSLFDSVASVLQAF